MVTVATSASNAQTPGVPSHRSVSGWSLPGLALLPKLDVWTAAALATMLALTGAALGLPVVTIRRLPSHIRHGLNVESGLNDGVCVPLLIGVSIRDSGSSRLKRGVGAV